MNKKVKQFASSVFTIFLLLTGASSCFGQTGGGVIVRVPVGPSPKCINSSTDQVWFTLYRVITTRRSGWFTSENQTEMVINVQVKTQPQADKPIAFPLSSKVSIRNYPTGQVSIPAEYTLVSGLLLKQGKEQSQVIYTGLGVDMTLVNLRGKNKLGAALQALDDITGSKKLPIPDTPYTQAVGYLMDYANKAVSAEIADLNGDDKYQTASLALNFDPTGTCSEAGPGGEGFETTGTKAILMSEGLQQSDGYIPIDKAQQYCWSADTAPVFVLKAALKVPGKPCTETGYANSWKSVTNNYVAFFLQKREVTPGHLGATSATQDREESLQLCGTLGLGMSNCPAAKP